MQKKIEITKMLYFYIFAFLGIMLFFCAVSLNPNNDMWWMMATGRYIIKNKIIPTINPFVIHDEYSIIIQQWITAIFNYLIYKYFGNWGFICVSILITVISIILTYAYISNFTQNSSIKVILTFCAGFIYSMFAVTRPTLFTIPIVLTEMILLEKWKRSRTYKWLIFIIPLSILEINIHAALWPIILILTFPYLVPAPTIKFLNELWNNKAILILDVAILFSGLLNPHGVSGMLYLIKSLKKTNLMAYIAELQPPTLSGVYGIIIIIQIITIVIYVMKNKTESDITIVYLSLGTITMSSLAIRNAWMSIIGCLPLFAIVIPNKFFRKKRFYEFWKILIINGVLLFCLFYLFSFAISNIDSKNESLKEAAKYLAEHTDPEKERIYTSFNDGGMFEWYGFKVYTDARPELYTEEINKKESIDDEIYAVETGCIDYKSFFNKYDFTYIIADKNKPIWFYMNQNLTYVSIYENDSVEIFKKDS